MTAEDAETQGGYMEKQVILLNGPSSNGKSSLAQVLQGLNSTGTRRIPGGPIFTCMSRKSEEEKQNECDL